MTAGSRTRSSAAQLPLRRKTREWAQQFGSLVRHRSPFARRDFTGLLAQVRDYDDHARRYIGRPLSECRVLEIGFGARPYRLFALHALGVDVLGVDLDQPVLRARDVLAVLRTNGVERALKSLVRFALFDLVENRRLASFLSAAAGSPFSPPADRLVVADAADPAFWRAHPGPYDFVYAEDVLEHVPEADLRIMLAELAGALSPGGIALVRPMVWTGLLGGHQVEYYSYRPGDPPSPVVPPWDHLRERRFPANTHLNELSRRDYTRLFGEAFAILEETVAEPGLGSGLLTPALRAELAAYDEEELLSNKVSFVLRPRKERSS